jgi:hypothetical protein
MSSVLLWRYQKLLDFTMPMYPNVLAIMFQGQLNSGSVLFKHSCQSPMQSAHACILLLLIISQSTFLGCVYKSTQFRSSLPLHHTTLPFYTKAPEICACSLCSSGDHKKSYWTCL